jgi:hypothetical protein
MEVIIADINEIFNDSTVCNGVQIHGICELAIKTDQPHPVAIVDKKQVAPNDRFDGTIYHRLLNDSISESEEYSFGSTKQKIHSQVVRTVVLIKFNKGKAWIDDLIDLIPQTIDGLTDYELVNINTIAKNTDQDAIFRTEFGESGYEKHRLSYHIYALEYTVEYILCA